MAAEGVSGDTLVADREGCAECGAKLEGGGTLRTAHRSLLSRIEGLPERG
jgi:hypothetical protein